MRTKTKIAKCEDGLYKQIDVKKCPYGQRPGITPCGLITCKHECVVIELTKELDTHNERTDGVFFDYLIFYGVFAPGNFEEMYRKHQKETKRQKQIDATKKQIGDLIATAETTQKTVEALQVKLNTLLAETVIS